jgi:hypothetical protein
MIPGVIATFRPPRGVAHGTYEIWLSGIMSGTAQAGGTDKAFARAAVRRSMSGAYGPRSRAGAHRRFPYASQRRNWEAGFLENLVKYLTSLVSAEGLEPSTP